MKLQSFSHSTATLLIIIIISTVINISNGARIIFLLPIASTSHKIVFDPLIKALALRDHDVTVVSPISSQNLPSSVKEIHPATVEELGYGLTSVGKDLLETRKLLKSSYFPFFQWNVSLVENGCHKLYKDVQIKYLLKGMKKFDLAIVSGLQNECALGLVDFFRIPHMYLTPGAAPNYVSSRFGHYFPTSYVPSPYTDFDRRMTFLERCTNFIVETILLVFARFYLYPQYEDIYRGYLGEDTPSIEEIEDNVGVVLINTNFIMSHPRPLPPNLIEVGGMHCRPPRPLPTELDKFLSEAEEGVIYFSFGSAVLAKDVPKHVIDIFLNVFADLDQRIIWKWDDPNVKRPYNVMVMPWLPQQDILGHKNLKLFISTGGLLSTQEAIYHGVPLLGVPLSGEHDLNMRQAERAGFARTWEILDMNQTQLEEIIDRMLIEPQYKARVKQLSKMYRELPEIALDKAIFWVNHVIINKGAPQLRSSAKDLNYFQYHSFDVIAVLLSLLLLTIYLLYYVISTLIRCCKSSNSSSVDVRKASCSSSSLYQGNNGSYFASESESVSSDKKCD
ncbi:unnamed protein product [Orchesella dallaii]|uniref:Uncharacterized protein n=1 Tax=Orchesella dallaii TaxID=48710 RepID=A0ABP1QQA7_9HEXA